MKTAAGVALIVGLCALRVMADSWPGPIVRNVFSENGQYFVRIIPGKSMGDVVGFAGSAKGPYARGEFYARQPDRSYKLVADAVLQNPISPTDGLVTNSGYLLTFDNWHNFGYGKAVAMYKPDGQLVRALTLEELYKDDRIRKIPTSVSSRWWRCSPHGFVDPDHQTEVFAFEHFGGTFTFKVQTGAFAYQPGKKKCDPPGGPFSASSLGR